MTVKSIVQNVRSPWLILPVFVIVVVVTATAWFFYKFEKEDYTINTGSSPQARRNPLLAAQEYLNQSGFHSKSSAGLDLLAELPPPTDALLIRQLPSGLSDTITTNLLNWVEQGGHLVVVPNVYALESDHPGKNTLFEQLGVEVLEWKKTDCGCPETDDEQTTSPSPDNQEAVAKSANNQQDADTEDPGSTGDPGLRKRLIITDLEKSRVHLETFQPRLLRDVNAAAIFSIHGSYFIVHENEPKEDLTQNEYIVREGSWLLQFERGGGRVTVMSEMGIFSNQRIGDYDHAFFLSWLVDEDATIWLQYSTEVSSFLTILWQKAPLFWLSVMILVVFLIWRQQMQSGPQLQLTEDHRQNIMHHIDATAQFNWRTANLSTMVENNRKTIWNELLSRKLGILTGRQKTDVTISRLVQKTGMTEEQLQATFQQTVATEQDIIRTTEYLQHIITLISGGEKRKK
ncbi:MAG: DUF4350 domain-containing protein [Desulfocapsaceae bacterium]|nr:DUF4350 domain-containing protein [Desulfocapsaceae bacterium]